MSRESTRDQAQHAENDPREVFILQCTENGRGRQWRI